MKKAIIQLRPFQRPIFADRRTGVQILHWSRQIGKSTVLAAWAVDRCLTRPGRLVTVLSNSKDNGAEFAVKAAEVLRQLDHAIEMSDGDQAIDSCEKLRESPVEYDAMRFEVRIRLGEFTSRIKVLAANPRTARGFSGDLILDEFAFHEDSRAIWEAAEPILSSHPDFLCRIASTGNGRHNMFYEMATSGTFAVSRVTRTEAWRQGVKIYDQRTRQPITPDEAREQALDKRAYDQNYECAFADENSALLTSDLINDATDNLCGVICEQDWTPTALARLHRCQGTLWAGVDVARIRNLSVVSIGEEAGGGIIYERATLRMRDISLPQQQARLDQALANPRLRRMCIDMTGLGLGLFEYTQLKHGTRVVGIHFGTSVPATRRIQAEGRKAPTVRVTEAMATELLARHQDKRIKYPCDLDMRDDLRRPEKVVTPGGRVSIAAINDAANHADHFWAKALMVEASSGPVATFEPRAFERGGDRSQARRERRVEA